MYFGANTGQFFNMQPNQQPNQNQQRNQGQQNNRNFANNRQQNQNQGKDSSDQEYEDQKPSKEFAFAVGPLDEDDIITVLDYIRMKANSNFNADYLYSENDDFPYFTVLVDNMELLKRITKIKKIEYKKKVVYISPSEYPIDNVYIDYIESIFPDCITGPFLDISDIKKKSRPNILLDGDAGIDINMRHASLPFLLFLCSLKCQKLNREIQYISFDYNFLVSPKHLIYFSDFFPSLRKMSLSGSKFDREGDKNQDDQNKNLNKKSKEMDNKKYLNSQLEILAKRDVTVQLETPINHFEFEDKKKQRFFFGHPGFRQPPPLPRKAMPLENVVVPEIISSNQENDYVSEYIDHLNQKQKIEIYRTNFTTNDFIANFIAKSNQSISTIYPYYTIHALFSLTVDRCPPNSPMAFYSQFSANRLTKDFLAQPYGPSSVINAQLEVFGKQINMIVSSINQKQVAKAAYAIVIHGVFNCSNIEKFYAFDRTMMVVETDTEIRFLICNDHIFIRNSRNL